MRPRDGAFLPQGPWWRKRAHRVHLARQGFLAAPRRRKPARMSEPPKAVQKARRERRLGAALRENLRRRKAQAKGRSAAAREPQARTPHDSAGIADDKQGN
jgi:hypothetical protein